MSSPVKVGKDNPSTDQVLFVLWEATEHSQVRKVIMRKNENKNINLKWLKLWKVFNTINWRGTTHFDVFDSEDDHCSGCRNVSSVTVNNSPIVFRTTFTRTVILNLFIRQLRWITELCAILLVKKIKPDIKKYPFAEKLKFACVSKIRTVFDCPTFNRLSLDGTDTAVSVCHWFKEQVSAEQFCCCFRANPEDSLWIWYV